MKKMCKTSMNTVLFITVSEKGLKIQKVQHVL